MQLGKMTSIQVLRKEYSKVKQIQRGWIEKKRENAIKIAIKPRNKL